MLLEYYRDTKNSEKLKFMLDICKIKWVVILMLKHILMLFECLTFYVWYNYSQIV